MSQTEAQVQPQAAAGMQIQIQNLQGKSYALDVQSSTTIREVKEMIHSKDQIPVEQQRLIFSGKQLEDNRSLSEYEIGAQSKLHLVLRLKGGGN